eukprot:TRINITY_DN10216_c0_g1_i1.p1 TRINITY_DN10216_c0_g1~~TRINITY_DN10216_c0_g1_i1.p1  ORF type:complete len:297 (+),score=89.77 TRINITY_DN10216_c0_g1_i1:169-1059(+)
MMRRTAPRLVDQRGDFIEQWVSRAKYGRNWGGRIPIDDQKNLYTPQMAIRGSPYPKFPARWGVPPPNSGIVPRFPVRDDPRTASRPVQWSDLDPPGARRREVRLPGKLWKSDLPQDPVDRLFFQVKSENASLLASAGAPDNPRKMHELTLELGQQGNQWEHDPLGHMCLTLANQWERRERFVTILARDDTKQIARKLLDLGFISGMRDYNNEWKFAIETRWWDNRPAIEHMHQLSLPARKARWWWDAEELRKVLYFNGVYNVTRIYFIRLDSGVIVTHPEAVRDNVEGGEPLCYVD